MPTVKYKDRPVCETENCHRPSHLNTDYHDGWANYRRWCAQCHSKRTAAKHGLKRMSQVLAKNAGFNSECEYLNSKHPYRKHRKDHCENVDGRLGFICTTTIFWDGMLDVDHKNGNPSDNRKLNLQTLCKCCHAYKTNKKGDYATPGRKLLKENKHRA
jgi:hypothetical protein